MSKRTNTVKITPATTQLVGESKTSTVTANTTEGHTVRSICAASGLDVGSIKHKHAVAGLVKYLLLTGAVTHLGRRHNVVKGRSLRGRPEEVYTFNSLDVLTQFANLPVPEATLTTTVAKKRPQRVKSAPPVGTFPAPRTKILPPQTLYTRKQIATHLDPAALVKALDAGTVIRDGFGWYRNNGAF